VAFLTFLTQLANRVPVAKLIIRPRPSTTVFAPMPRQCAPTPTKDRVT
jgi:hypothetical protein